MKTTTTVIRVGCIGFCLAAISALASAQAAGPAQTPKATSMPSSAPSAGSAEAGAYDAHAIIASADLPAHSIVEQFQSGYIDWTNGKAVAVGEGKATGTAGQQIDMAQRAARLGAGRNAVLLMGNISVGPDGRFVDVAKANIRVDAVLEDFEEISSAFDPKTQIVTVSLAVPLYGAHGVIHVLGANSAQPSTPATPSQNQDAKDAAAETVSVIVIDARGTAIKPCLLPQIVGGKPAGVIFTARESDLDNHPAAIYVTLPAVKADNAEGTFDAPLQAPSPAVLVLKAGDVDEKTPGAIVLNTQESAKLQMHPQWRQLLSAGRLIVITGRDQ